ncbi:DVU_1556 family methyltransferase [Desulfolutivibrio sulfoxidireducens]|uniref:DVU_1556 family methyltransferase n=1 Tax=Desulfolutivibrio sulfoxidireducens TaxID=2773299 RepID=UPI00159E78C9|nr:methyltransferase domain-containing protein [Desulfolutivibrio sulfoxidireducens]QLA15492.1 methyltransferase domain-containing protein [Desulfolutivibrio sulfoxidireducens]QLA19090.1 methyltransferase domain-containing protein [Desulfolutivibrio sulfoxidireducens]
MTWAVAVDPGAPPDASSGSSASAGDAPLFLRWDFRAVAGEALRPGGLTLTARGVGAAGLSPGEVVADVGCGPGASLDYLRGRGLFAVGVEVRPDLAAEAACRVPGGVLLARAGALPFGSGRLDGVLCECALSVFDDPDAALAEMARVLRPGGRLVVADLYRRDEPEEQEVSGPGGCAAGAVSRAGLARRLARCGLVSRLFEDHSRLLAELAGRLIFAGFSAADVGAALAGRRCGPGSGVPCAPGGRRLGYYLCVAKKEAA